MRYKISKRYYTFGRRWFGFRHVLCFTTSNASFTFLSLRLSLIVAAFRRSTETANADFIGTFGIGANFFNDATWRRHDAKFCLHLLLLGWFGPPWGGLVTGWGAEGAGCSRTESSGGFVEAVGAFSWFPRIIKFGKTTILPWHILDYFGPQMERITRQVLSIQLQYLCPPVSQRWSDSLWRVQRWLQQAENQ